MEPNLEELLKELNAMHSTNDHYEDDLYLDNYDELEELVANKEITPEICEEYGLDPNSIIELLQGNISPEECRKLGFDSYYVTELILYNGDIEEYLVPEKCKELGLSDNDINILLQESEQEACQDYIGMGYVGLIQLTGNAEKYLSLEYLKKLNLSSKDVIQLIEITGNIEKYLTPEICDTAQLDTLEIINLIRKTNNLDKYITNGEIKQFKLEPKNPYVIDLINEAVNEKNFKIIYDLGYDHTILKSVDLIRKNLDKILEMEGFQDKKDIIKRLSEKNIDFLKANFEISNDKYIEILGEDKVNQISCYPKYLNKVISLNENQLKIIEKCVDFYQMKNNTDEWGVLFSKIIENIDDYNELIESVTDSNIEYTELDELINVLIHDNFLNITKIDDVQNIEALRKEKCTELLNSDNIDDKINAISIFMYGQSSQELKQLITKYGECIDDIQDEDLKCYIKSIDLLFKVDNPEIFNEIFQNVEPVKNNNFIECERLLKNEYWKLYKNQLLTTDEVLKGNEIEENIYELPEDENGNIRQFSILLTSIDYANNLFNNGFDNDTKINNYYDSWNRAAIGAQHISGSYIRRDMLVTAPRYNICYGFYEMSNDALVLSGPSDIASSWSLESYARHTKCERYYSPDVQINKSFDYNEMDIKRFQDGKRKQPDYIVVFKKEGIIENIEEARRASEQFKEHTGKNLPIVVIDEEKCLETERNLLEQMIEEYQDNASIEKANLIIQKIANNRKTNSTFATDITFRNPKIRQKANQSVSEQELQECFNEVKPEDRINFITKFKNLYRQNQQAKQKEEYNNEGR